MTKTIKIGKRSSPHHRYPGKAVWVGLSCVDTRPAGSHRAVATSLRSARHSPVPEAARAGQMIYLDAEDLFKPSFGFSCLGIKFDVAEGSEITVVHGVARDLEALGHEAHAPGSQTNIRFSPANLQ